MSIIQFFKEVYHLYKMQTSEHYRKMVTLNEGKELWEKIDKQLPPAEGVTNLDKVRLRMFSEKVELLTLEERLALKFWLSEKTKKCQNEFTEHTTGLVEEIERKHWQIYSQHLEVMIKLT